MSVTVRTSGPVFNGEAQAAAHEFAVESGHEVASKGVQMVQRNLHGVLRHPTGRYEHSITAPGSIIYGDRVIYGAWLEGVGSRNRTTRFKGYFTFRRTVGELRMKSIPIAEGLLQRKYLKRMN